MPSLHQLCKSLYSRTESQNRLKFIFGRSSFSIKPTSGFASGECVFQFEVTGPSWRVSEAADPCRPLSIPEAASRTLATPSVNGRVWNSCYSNPCQVLLEKNHPLRLKKRLCSTLALPMFASKLHVCSLDPPFGRSTDVVSLINCGNHQDRACSPESSVHSHDWSELLSKPPLWRCAIDGSGHCNGSFNEAQRNNKFSIDWPLKTSVAFHLMRSGLFLFPAAPQSLEFLSTSVKSVVCSFAVQPGAVVDCTTDKCNPELAENHSEGRLTGSGLRLLSGACCLPHPEKQDTGGEDAYFICPDKQVIGVADGVGGWADMGIDAGEYARQLMNQSLIAAQQEPAGCIDTVRVMEIAHSKTTCRGSSTACILALSNDCLQAANLGDSGFLVVRNGRLVFKSPPQQHNFNVPFQLENGGGDPPDAAQVFNVDVAAGDVIVAGTDGLFDNLYETDILGLVVQAARVGSGPDITAKKIASLARERAKDCNRQTPFSAAAQDAGFRFYGGKMDDITVVVSYVVK